MAAEVSPPEISIPRKKIGRSALQLECFSDNSRRAGGVPILLYEKRRREHVEFYIGGLGSVS
jgi:hypothetical protein